MNLKVLEAYTRDIQQRNARLDYDTMDQLNLNTGDIIDLKYGGFVFRAKVVPLYPSDEGKGIIRIDKPTRDAISAKIGDDIEVRRSINQTHIVTQEDYDIISRPNLNLTQQANLDAATGMIDKFNLLIDRVEKLQVMAEDMEKKPSQDKARFVQFPDTLPTESCRIDTEKNKSPPTTVYDEQYKQNSELSARMRKREQEQYADIYNSSPFGRSVNVGTSPQPFMVNCPHCKKEFDLNIYFDKPE